jgi:hypothetical protein
VKPGNLPKSNALLEIGQHWTEGTITSSLIFEAFKHLSLSLNQVNIPITYLMRL